MLKKCGIEEMVRDLVLFPLLLILSIISQVVSVQADESLEAAGLCHNIENLMNALVDYTATKCFPSSAHGAISFALIAEKPIFSVKASKKPWLLVTVGAVWKTMNEHPKIKSSSVYVSDTNLMKDRKA